jgi:ribosomal-protein-serine acetyltransferase
MFSLSVAPNLELRHFELHQTEILFALIDQSRLHLRRYLGFVDLSTLITVEDFIRRSREKFVQDGTGNFAIWQGETLVGVVSLFDYSKNNRKAEIGYWIGQAFIGKGIMTKAVRGLIDYAFAELGLNRIQLCCATDNLASRQIAQKMGFTLEGVAREDRLLRGSRVTHEIWGLLVKDWQLQPAAFAKILGDGTELRLLESKHAPIVFASVDSNRSHLRQFLPWVDNNTTLVHSEQFIKSTLEQFKDFDGFTASIWQDNQFAGLIGMHFIDWEHKDTEFGYWLAESFTGQGLVTKAATALLDYIFFELNLHRVAIAHALENTASQKVIERLGFKPESMTRDAEWLYTRFHDWQRYALLRREWQHLSLIS